MYLVEYTQLKHGNIFEYCSGFYYESAAMDFAIKLKSCSNIGQVKVSHIDTSDADVIYDSCEE